MNVKAPGTQADGIVPAKTLHAIVLRKDLVADKTPRLAHVELGWKVDAFPKLVSAETPLAMCLALGHRN